MPSDEYKSGYGQALADVLAHLTEATRMVERKRGGLEYSDFPRDAEEAERTLKAQITALAWVRAQVKALRRR